MANTQKVIVYTSPGWGACHTAKEFLSERNIDVEERDVSNPTVLEEMVKNTGARSVPVIIIGDETLIGWDQGRVEQLLNL